MLIVHIKCKSQVCIGMYIKKIIYCPHSKKTIVPWTHVTNSKFFLLKTVKHNLNFREQSHLFHWRHLVISSTDSKVRAALSF